MQKNTTLFDTKSLHIVELPTGRSKYVQNRIICRKHNIFTIKVNHRVLHNFPGAQTLIYVFPRSLIMIRTNTMQFSAEKINMKTCMEPKLNAQLKGNAMETIGSSDHKP